MTLVETKKGRAGRGRQHGRFLPARTRRKFSRVDTMSAWVLLAPALILFIVFIIIPTVVAIGLSFYSWNFFDSPEFVGAANFVKMFGDADAWRSLGITMLYVVLGVIPTIIVGFLLAVLINVNLPGVAVVRVLYFVPVVLSAAVSAVLWMFLYDPRQGPIASFLRLFGIQAPSVLTDTTLALPALVLMMIWLALPIVVILYLAGLQRVPADIYEAAALDGSRPWRTIWSITWPNVTATTFVVVVLQIINFVAGSLDVSLIMTGGGPLGSTRALTLYAYQQAFVNQSVGYANALSVLQMVVIVAIIAVGRLAIRRISR